MMSQEIADQVLRLTAQIVSAHVSNNSLQSDALPALIRAVHLTLAAAGEQPPAAKKLEPAVPIKRSVFPDYIVCLEDGNKLKMLKRHLQTAYGMTPNDYRERWGLPRDYPMVAPNYAASRSSLAKKAGLGRKSVEPEPTPEPPPVEVQVFPAKARGRPKRVAAPAT